jgi:hypothetical protein
MRALNSQLLGPIAVLTSLCKVIPELPAAQGIARYPLLRIINQAVTLWKPSSPASAETIALLWSVEQILYSFITRNDVGQDHILFVEILDTWNKILSSRILRPILRAENEKSSGRPCVMIR